MTTKQDCFGSNRPVQWTGPDIKGGRRAYPVCSECKQIVRTYDAPGVRAVRHEEQKTRQRHG